ncbi:MAG: hypothetical protein V4650_05805 [Pseudomonadota bacterium]
MKLHNVLMYSVLTLGIGLTACEKKPETAIEKLEDKVKDGLDARPNENLQDAGEDAAKALENAGEAAKDAVTPDPK